MKQARMVCFLALGFFLAGCVKQEPNISLPESFWQNSKRQITVAKTKNIDKPQLHKKGQQGLLD